MDLGRIGLFVVLGAASVYYGLTQGRMSMMIAGIAISIVGILNALIMNKRKK